ncbi:MAG: hypothetical protein ACI861_001937 [Paracoccaceae bacterium]|jgi:hypothetical protein
MADTSKFPTLAEINEVERRAHRLRAEATISALTTFGNFLKSTVRRIGVRKPNLVHTFLEA